MRLDELSDVNMGQSPAGDSLNDSTGVEFHQGKIYFGDLVLGRSPTKTNATTKMAKPGDVLMCVRAPVGVVNLTDREVCIGRGLAALTPKAGVPKRFLLHLLHHHHAAVEQMATGSTFASITTEQLKSLEIPVPNRQSWLRIAGVMRKRVWTTHHSHYLSTNSNLERCLSISLSSFAPCALRSARRDLNPEIFSANSSAVIGTYSIFTSKYCPAESV